jgi:predicted metallopeptidase
MASSQQTTAGRARSLPPLTVHWNTLYAPLPVREVAGTARSHSERSEANPCIETGEEGAPFDFSMNVRRLCEDIVARCEPLKHLNVSQILFSFTQSRNSRSHGLQARVTPLRFSNGARTRIHRGVPYRVQQYFHDGQEVLYVLTFCLPRFLDRDFDDKFVTIFHELFHISPIFDGDLRRHKGRYSIHSGSQKSYDREMAAIAREYLQSGGDQARFAFLRLNYAQLKHRHGKVLGHVVPRPKLIPIRSDQL